MDKEQAMIKAVPNDLCAFDTLYEREIKSSSKLKVHKDQTVRKNDQSAKCTWIV